MLKHQQQDQWSVSFAMRCLLLRRTARRPTLAPGAEELRLDLWSERDGEGRDGWTELAPGLGREKDPGRFPVLSLA